MPSQKIIAKKLTASVEQIESRIFVIRGHCERVELKTPGTRRRPPCGGRVMLDANLMSQIATSSLRSHIVTLNHPAARAS